MRAHTAHSAPHRPVRVEAARTVTVRWAIARAALAPRLGDVPGPSSDVTLELSATSSPDGWVCRACLIDGAARVPVETPPTTATGWVTDDERNLEHLDLPGFLHATMRSGAVLYARTPLLGALGVAGGRYELNTPAGSQ